MQVIVVTLEAGDPFGGRDSIGSEPPKVEAVRKFYADVLGLVPIPAYL